MYKIRSFYYQNKEKIWKVVLLIAFILGIIYFMNQKATENRNSEDSNTSNNSHINYLDDENKTYISDKSAVSGGSITDQDVKK